MVLVVMLVSMKPEQLYPSDLADNEWTVIEALIPPTKPGGRPPITDFEGRLP